MDFRISKRSEELIGRVRQFVNDEVIPNELRYQQEIAESGQPYRRPPIMVEMRGKARSAGLWNLFMQDDEWTGEPLSTVEYAPVFEQMTRSTLGPEAFNCQPPDTGNMSMLAACGTPAQQERWLVPMLEGEICSCFSMTEPGISSSDARNIKATIERDGDEFAINARKWFSTGAAKDTCKVCFFLGVTDPVAEPFPEQSIVLVPLDTPGVEIVRTMTVFGYQQPMSQGEIHFTDVRVPIGNLLQLAGDGFEISQKRLGAGRVHHSMRGIGMAERALELMCQRVASRETFGVRLADQGVIQDWIARSRLEIEQARLLTLKAAWTLDELGGAAARREISAMKAVTPGISLNVIDRAIQAHGAEGVSQDTALAEMWSHARALRIADGPDEVHIRSLGRWELKAQLSAAREGAPAKSLVS